MKQNDRTPLCRQRSAPRHLVYQGEPPECGALSDDPIEALNDLVKHVGAAIKKETAKTVREQRVRRQQQDIKAWSDAKFYTVLVFDTGNQCQAFIDAIKAKPHVSLQGDLFLDGRQVANAFGVALPKPSYELKRHRTEARRARKLTRKSNGQA